MALFTDGPMSTLDQLAAEDTAVLDVASTEGIDATAKLSLAQEELGVELVSAFSRAPFSNPSLWWPGSPLSFQPTLQLSNMVVTAPLRLWHTFHTLSMIYRDAYNSQLSDRYLGKWNAYTKLAKWASDMLFQTGIGMVANPVPIAANPQVSVVDGPFSAATYFAQVTWLNSSGQEGMASGVTSLNAPDQSSIQVTAINPPASAIAWNIYVGTSIDSVTLQNSAPIQVGETWILPPSGLISGSAVGTGQSPDSFRPAPRYLQRG